MTVNHKHSVLIVDDEPEIRDVLASVVKAALPDSLIVQAGDGADALKRIDLQFFDLVLTDLEMPRMNGGTLMQHCSQLDDKVRPRFFIIVSAHAQPNGIPTRLGKVVYIPKPAKRDVIIDAVHQFFPNGSGAAKPDKSFKVDVSFINPFIDATLNVLETMASVKATKKRVFIRKDDHAQGDISAIIAMNSQMYLASMAISFEEKCFLSIVNNMLGEKYNAINAENSDAAAEICNQVCGGAKKVLGEQGHKVEQAIPSIVTGKGHVIKHSALGPCIVVEFDTAQGYFLVEAVVQVKG